MKKILSLITIGAVMAVSCNTTPKTDETKVTSAPDTTGFAQFQQWKAQNELPASQQMTQNSSTQPTRTVVKYVPRTTGTINSESSNTAKASSQKKGWSKAAKGAVIGGVGGAAAGAVINKKNRAAGAVIGGVLGAGAGYGIGRSKDKKDGRY
jgi:hypothetical protein